MQIFQVKNLDGTRIQTQNFPTQSFLIIATHLLQAQGPLDPQLVASTLGTQQRLLQLLFQSPAVKPRVCSSCGVAFHLLDSQAPATELGSINYVCLLILLQWTDLLTLLDVIHPSLSVQFLLQIHCRKISKQHQKELTSTVICSLISGSQLPSVTSVQAKDPLDPSLP